MRKFRSATLLPVLLLFLLPLHAQQGTVDVTQLVYSSYMGMDVNYSIYLPASYGSDTAATYPVLYLLHGMSGNYLDWPNNGMGTITDMEVNAGRAIEQIIVMPDGMDSWYCNLIDDRSLLYEDFMIEEFIPYIESTYRAGNTRETRAIAGLSMGGYGATFLGFKWQDMFNSVYSMSGAVLLDGPPDLKEIINAKSSDELNTLPAYTMEIGTSDFLLTNNDDFHRFLNQKSIPHTYITRSGTHNWDFWTACLPKTLTFASEHYYKYVGMEPESSETGFLIYPNPACEIVSVYATADGFLRLYNSTGSLVRTCTMDDHRAELDVSDFCGGCYFLQLVTENGILTRKLIISPSPVP